MTADPTSTDRTGTDRTSADRPPSGAVVQVYTPYRRGLPALRPYLSELWRRRHFAIELARSEVRTQNTGTGLGQLWLVLNPLLLTVVYYLLTAIIAGRPGGAAYLAHIMAGLFLFYFLSGCVTGGAGSIVGGGRLVLNTAFPKLLLPVSVVLLNAMRFVPALGVYAVVHVAAGLPSSPAQLWGLLPLLLVVLFATGLASFTATLTLYLRDTRAFLPYVMRVWLYLSPVLWLPEQVPHAFAAIRWLNPLFPLLGAWSDAVVEGVRPSTTMLVVGTAWAVGALVVGALFLLSREREFAVRL